MAMLREAAIASAKAALQNPEFLAAVRQHQGLKNGQIDDHNDAAVPLQLAASVLFGAGRDKILNALLAKRGWRLNKFKIPRRIKPDQLADYNPVKLLAQGTAFIGASAALAYLSPPVVVEEGWRNQSWDYRQTVVASLDW